MLQIRTKNNIGGKIKPKLNKFVISTSNLLSIEKNSQES